MLRTYKLYSSAAATGNNQASVTMVRPGYIRNIRWSLTVDSPTDNGEAIVELSLQPTSSITVNDSRGAIDQVGVRVNLVTSGLVHSECHASRTDMRVPVGAGERLYHHCQVATATYYCATFIDVEE